jgi:hypothetical protein
MCVVIGSKESNGFQTKNEHFSNGISGRYDSGNFMEDESFR